MDQKEPMELKEGRMAIKDLSVWFGLQPSTLSNCSQKAREKKFKILTDYAEYHFEGNKLFIDKVKYPVYSKAYKLIEEEMPKRWGHIKDGKGNLNATLKNQRIDTCARVGKDIYKNVPGVAKQIKVETSQAYVNRIKIRDYGHNYLDDKGKKGHSESVWMNREGTAPLEEADLAKLKECAKQAYGSMSIKMAEIDDEVKHGNITREEANKAIGEIREQDDAYARFTELVIAALGFYPEKRTRLVDEYSWE